jgi:hypothetical protein
MNFKELINNWLAFQSMTINVDISAARYRIFDAKKDTENFLRNGMSNDDVWQGCKN